MTPAQARALEALWPRYGIDAADASFDVAKIFVANAPLAIEIGYGNGDALVAMAVQQPQCNYLGIEVHRPGVGSLLRKLEVAGIDNVRVAIADAKDVLARLPDACLDSVHLYFPDPWPKTRHHKRRLVQPDFVEVVQRKLKVDGTFYLATDWENYAEHMLAVLTLAPGLTNIAGVGCFSPRSALRPLTKFERRGEKLGHVVYDLQFRRIG